MTEPLVVTIPHRLGKDEAKARIQGGFGRAKGEFAHLISIQNDTWEGDRLSFAASALGQHAHGFIDVYEGARAAGGDAALAAGALRARGAADCGLSGPGVAGEEIARVVLIGARVKLLDGQHLGSREPPDGPRAASARPDPGSGGS